MAKNQIFFFKKIITKKNKNKIAYILLVMPKYWGKQILSLGSFPEVGKKQKTGGKEKRKETERS